MKLTCPTKNRLREFLEGSVSDAEADQISDHVEGCSSCDLVLSTLEGEQGDLLKELREGVRTESLLQEPEFEKLRNTARFGQADTTASSDIDEQRSTGKRLRDYRLVKKIGEGGMGTVYQAFHVHLAKHVALKILPADKLRSKQSVSRFRQEMRAVGSVNHPNVVSASDAGTVDGQHFLVMELVQGADLARIIHDRGPLKVADACEIVRQAAIGLQHAHDNGLVHRDVKPSNIMLTIDGNVKLLDLGLAGLNNSEFESTANVVVTDRLTAVGQIMGTLDYMAPEQIAASPEVDGKADIYALGATLFQLLTGRTPCGDRSEGTPQRIEAVLHKPPLEIATLRNDVPEELCTLLLKMLEKKPEDRPQAAKDVAGELERFASDADLAALAEACRTSLDMPSADVDVTDDVSFVVSRATQPQDEGNSRKPFTAIAIAGFFLALFAAVVYYIQTDNGVVRVRVMDDSLAVMIKGQMVEMKDGDKQLTIRAGHHNLEVSYRGSDFKFVTDQFKVQRNGEIAFEVDLIPGRVVVRQEGKTIKEMSLPEDALPNETNSLLDKAIATKPSDFDEIDRELYGTPSGREMMAEMYRKRPDEQKSVAEKLIAEGKDEAARRILSLVVPPDPKAMAVLDLAQLHEKAGDFEKAANAYLEAYRITPALLDDEHLPAITKAGRVQDLVEVLTEDRLRTLPFNNRASRVVNQLLKDKATREEGYKLHRRWWAATDRDHYGWLINPQRGDFWKEIPDPAYYLRSKLLPPDVASEGNGWKRFRVEVEAAPLASPPVWGMPLGLKPLLHNKDELRQIAQEVKAAIKQHPDWQAGAALLCFLEAEVGNTQRSVELLNQVLADAESQPVPPQSAWIFGLSLEGRSAELDRLVMRLYEHSLRNWPAQGELRDSPISSLATLYGKYDRRQEARQLLSRLAVDNYHIDTELTAFASAICSDGRIPQNANRCTECHKKERNLFDVTLMSQKLTDIGYPVDALLSLYRIDSSFGNAYGSDDEWAKKTTPQDFNRGGRSKFLSAKTKAEKAVAPQAVLEALKSGVFSSRDMTKLQTSDADLVIDLMTSVRGVDGKPTLFSPVVEVLELAAKAKKDEAAVANVQIDQLLSEAFDKNPDNMEAGIAAAVFAFLRKDLEAAERRAHNLHECVTRRAPQKDDIALWLVARHALQNERTREIGGKLTDRAVTAAEQNNDPGKKAIIHERNKLVGLKPNPSNRPQEKARQAESPTSSNAEELAAIAWVKSVDGRIMRAKSKRGSRPVDYVGLRRGAGSDFNAAPATDEGLKHLAAFPELRKLDLGTSPKVTSDGIKGLKELPKLIDLSYSPRRKDCVQALIHLTNLKRLNLFQGNLTDSDLTFLSGLSLEKLCLSYTSVSDDGLKHIVPLSKLDALHLEKTLVSDAGMKQLVTMESLRTLDLSQTKITKSGLKELTRLKKLQVLSLAGLEIGDAEVELLSAFRSLEKLSLHNNPVTDAGMKTVGRLRELRRLSLVSTEITDEGLQLLATCSKLEMVDLYNTRVTRKGTAALRKALPNCVMTRSFSYGGIPDLKITRTKTGVILKAAEDGWP